MQIVLRLWLLCLVFLAAISCKPNDRQEVSEAGSEEPNTLEKDQIEATVRQLEQRNEDGSISSITGLQQSTILTGVK